MESELTFIAPEGVYSNIEEHKPTQLNAHLVPAQPSLYPTRISTVVVRYPQSKPAVAPGLAQLLGGNNSKNREKEQAREREREILKEKEDGQSLSSSERQASEEDGTSGSPEKSESPALQPSLSQSPMHEHAKGFLSPSMGMKKKSVSRPKHNIRTTTSTFVTRLHSAEGLTRTLQNKQGDVSFLFYNHAKNFFWSELGLKAKEPLARITFSAYPTCHDVNKHTASFTSLDIVIGFNTGDLIWFDPITGRYVRLNKQGCISNSPCTAVKWVPGSPSVFIVSHADGTIIVYDKERDDGLFTPHEPFKRASAATGPLSQPESSHSSIPSDDTASSKEEWDPLESIFVTVPRWHPAAAHLGGLNLGRSEKDRTPKNPVSHWRVSKRSVVGITYSSDARLVAATSDDGCLRVIDALQESLLDCFASYFGSFTCVAFSADNRFIVAGGQDDLVTIFSVMEGRVIARCQGHSSFVSSVAFDPVRTDKRSYRFGSVGEDDKLILWDFSAGVLHRPKLQASHQQRLSMSSTLSLALRRREPVEGSTLHLPPSALADEGSKYHPAPSRNEVAVVQPVLIKHIEGDLLTDIAFTPSAVLTSSKIGTIKLWVRPLTLRPRATKQKIRVHHSEDTD